MIYTKIESEQPDIAPVVDGLSEIIKAVGTEMFAASIAHLMFNCFKVAEFFVFQRTAASDTPVMLLSDSLDDRSGNRARSYCGGFFRLDPIYSVLNDANPDGTYAIRIRADEIHNTAFRNTCYTQPGIAEKLTLASKLQDHIIAISVFGHEVDGGLDAAQVSELNQLGHLLLPILNLHFRLIASTDREKRISSRDMEVCVARAFPELTQREIAVCARTILGVTAEGIALDLGIKQTSVLTYRRRAYTRLNINSINQLSTILIQSSAARQLAAA